MRKRVYSHDEDQSYQIRRQPTKQKPVSDFQAWSEAQMRLQIQRANEEMGSRKYDGSVLDRIVEKMTRANNEPNASGSPAQATASEPPLVQTMPETETVTSQEDSPARVNEAVPSRTAKAQPLQAKLTVGPANDRYEQEADRVAQQVVQQIHAPGAAQQNGDAVQTGVQRESTPEEEADLQLKPVPAAQRLQRLQVGDLRMKAGEPLQREPNADEDELQLKQKQPVGAAGGAVSADVEGEINRARGGGQALAPALQTQMGQAMGADFSGVRVHADARADALNRSVGARAFTTGQDLFFKRGEYQPGSKGGQELIAHELTHVVQQPAEIPARRVIMRLLDDDLENGTTRLAICGEIHNPEQQAEERNLWAMKGVQYLLEGDGVQFEVADAGGNSSRTMYFDPTYERIRDAWMICKNNTTVDGISSTVKCEELTWAMDEIERGLNRMQQEESETYDPEVWASVMENLQGLIGRVRVAKNTIEKMSRRGGAQYREGAGKGAEWAEMQKDDEVAEYLTSDDWTITVDLIDGAIAQMGSLSGVPEARNLFESRKNRSRSMINNANDAARHVEKTIYKVGDEHITDIRDMAAADEVKISDEVGVYTREEYEGEVIKMIT